MTAMRRNDWPRSTPRLSWVRLQDALEVTNDLNRYLKEVMGVRVSSGFVGTCTAY